MSVLRVTITGTLYGSTCQNVLHFDKSDFVSSELMTLVTDIRDKWIDVYKNFVVTEGTFISIRAEVLTSGGVGEVITLPISIVGGAGNDVRSPLMMSIVLKLSTGLAGRKNRGRIFTWGTSVGAMVNGLWTSSALTTYNGYVTTLTSRWISGTAGVTPFRLCLLGKNDDPVDKRTITSMSVRSTPGCQRRRELGVGI